MRPKATLEQWITLAEIDTAGSIQAASLRLNKSHTTLIYAIRKLESQLDVTLLRLDGRKSVLTDDAKILLRRAVPMIEQARNLEAMSMSLSKGVESEIVVSIDHLCCRDWLFRPLQTFLAQNNSTSIQIIETCLSSTLQSVKEKQVDLAIVNLPVENHLAEFFGATSMIPVVSKSHPFAKMDCVTNEDLLATTQIIIRDSGAKTINEARNVGWLKSQQRITVDTFDHAWEAVNAGLGFCRLPEHMLNSTVTTAINTENIVRFNLIDGLKYQVPLHLVKPKAEKTGIAANMLFDILHTDAKQRTGNGESR